MGPACQSSWSLKMTAPMEVAIKDVKLVSGDQKIEVRPGVFVIYALDPEGNYVEFLEYSDIASYRRDLYK